MPRSSSLEICFFGGSPPLLTHAQAGFLACNLFRRVIVNDGAAAGPKYSAQYKPNIHTFHQERTYE